jgi:hypothetical protein
MSTIELQIVSPRADNAYSGKTVAADTRAHTLAMWRRTPMSYYHPRADAVVADVVEDTFTLCYLDVRGGPPIGVLCDAAASPKDVIEHLLARDREFRRLEDKYGWEFENWRRRERAVAEDELQATVEKDPVT